MSGFFRASQQERSTQPEAEATRRKGLPLLSDFDAGAYADYMQFAVIHTVKSKNPYEFEVGFVGDECAIVLGMSRERRVLGPENSSINAEDVYKRLCDAAAYKHPHFCVKTLGWQGRSLTKYEVLLLPFGDADAEGTVVVFSVMSFSSGFDSKYWLIGSV